MTTFLTIVTVQVLLHWTRNGHSPYNLPKSWPPVQHLHATITIMIFEFVWDVLIPEGRWVKEPFSSFLDESGVLSFGEVNKAVIMPVMRRERLKVYSIWRTRSTRNLCQTSGSLRTCRWPWWIYIIFTSYLFQALASSAATWRGPFDSVRPVSPFVHGDCLCPICACWRPLWQQPEVKGCVIVTREVRIALVWPGRQFNTITVCTPGIIITVKRAYPDEWNNSALKDMYSRAWYTNTPRFI